MNLKIEVIENILYILFIIENNCVYLRLEL